MLKVMTFSFIYIINNNNNNNNINNKYNNDFIYPAKLIQHECMMILIQEHLYRNVYETNTIQYIQMYIIYDIQIYLYDLFTETMCYARSEYSDWSIPVVQPAVETYHTYRSV